MLLKVLTRRQTITKEELKRLGLQIDEMCDSKYSKLMSAPEVEKQRKYLKDLVKRHPISFSTEFKAGLLNISPVKLKLNKTENRTCILSTIDILTGFVVFAPMTSVTWGSIQKTFIRVLIFHFGLPDAVHADNKTFSEAGHEWLKQLGIEW